MFVVFGVKGAVHQVFIPLLAKSDMTVRWWPLFCLPCPVSEDGRRMDRKAVDEQEL